MILTARNRLARHLLATLLLTLLAGCSLNITQAKPIRSADRSRAKNASMAPRTPPDRYLSHIAILAHDELGGRNTGSDGIDIAAGYVAGQFAAIGLQPGGPGGTYFQEFTISRPPELGGATELTVEGASVAPAIKEDFLPFSFSATGSFSGDVTFVGYGINNPDKDYDDYDGVDVTGHVVVMFRREPPGWDEDGGYTDHARFDSKVKLALEKGAVAVLVVNQDPGEDGIDGLMRFRRRKEDQGLPALHVKRELAGTLFAAAGLGSLTELQNQLDETGNNASAQLDGISVSGNVDFEVNDILARNVVGILPGTGPNAAEHVVIGAHYDHVGTRRGKVYNGADDNASGTAGVIELARALAQTPNRNRSIVLMTFAGEEMGLHGSRHFVAEPTVDRDSIVAMLNLDMIGRMTPDDRKNWLGVIGLGTGDGFAEIVERRAAEVGIDYLPSDGALTNGGSSDHASFYRGDVPTIFFFTGIHEDLHQPTDDTELINAEGAVQIVELIYRVALDIVNRDTAPVFAQVSERVSLFRGSSSGSRGGGVSMGIMPDMDDESDAPGWRVARVFPNTGAAKAGMKPGDRILSLDDQTINGFRDYRKATADKKPGDTIKVLLRRGKEKLTLDVELAARGS